MTGLEIVAEIARLRRTPLGSIAVVNALFTEMERFIAAANNANAAPDTASKPTANAANGKPDRKAYMRELMRKRRAAQKTMAQASKPR